MKNIQHSTFNAQGSTIERSCGHWMLNVGCWLLNVPKSVLIFLIRLYRWTISPAMVSLFGPGSGCRFTPSCSQYAMDAIRSRGALAGGWLAVKRICRCHPRGGCGHDPALEKEFRIPNSEFRI